MLNSAFTATRRIIISEQKLCKLEKKNCNILLRINRRPWQFLRKKIANNLESDSEGQNRSMLFLKIPFPRICENVQNTYMQPYNPTASQFSTFFLQKLKVKWNFFDADIIIFEDVVWEAICSFITVQYTELAHKILNLFAICADLMPAKRIFRGWLKGEKYLK